MTPITISEVRLSNNIIDNKQLSNYFFFKRLEQRKKTETFQIKFIWNFMLPKKLATLTIFKFHKILEISTEFNTLRIHKPCLITIRVTKQYIRNIFYIYYFILIRGTLRERHYCCHVRLHFLYIKRMPACAIYCVNLVFLLNRRHFLLPFLNKESKTTI